VRIFLRRNCRKAYFAFRHDANPTSDPARCARFWWRGAAAVRSGGVCAARFGIGPAERCTISAAPETAATLAPAVSPVGASAVLVTLADVAELPSAPAGDVRRTDATTPPRALHVLNSVFRI